MPNAQAPLRTSLLLLGVSIVAVGQLVMQDLPLEQRRMVVWLGVMGIVLFLAAAASVVTHPAEQSRVERIIGQMAHWLRLADWQAVCLIASPLFSWAAWRAAGEDEIMTNPVLSITVWIIAIALAIAGSWGASFKRISVERRVIALPLVLTVAAFLARGLALDKFPIILAGDEGSAGLVAVSFINGTMNNPFVSAWYSFPSLSFFFQSLSIELFSQTTEAVRLPSAVIGALTVTAVFYAGSAMFDRRTGTLAAIFLVAYAYHVHFSRIGLNNIWDGLWYIIVIGALWYGWTRENFQAFSLAGFSLGAAQYFYPSGRALIIPIVLWLIFMAALNRPKFRRIVPGLLIMMIVSLVVVLPLALFYWHHPLEYLAPFVRVSIFGRLLDGMVQSTGQPAWLILLTQIGKSLQGFTYLPITHWYQPGTPLLRPFAASLFLVGLVFLFLRSRSDKFLLLALWILTFGIIGGWSESTPASQRYIAAAPVCALLVGYGLSETTSVIESLWQQHRRLFQGVAIAVMVLITLEELHFYFNTYTAKTVVDWSHNPGMVAQRLANYLHGKPSDLQVVFMGSPVMGYYSIPSLQFLAPQIKGVDAILPWTAFDKSGLAETRLLFVLLPGNVSALEEIKREYPGGQVRQEIASDGNPLYWYYEYSSK